MVSIRVGPSLSSFLGDTLLCSLSTETHVTKPLNGTEAPGCRSTRGVTSKTTKDVNTDLIWAKFQISVEQYRLRWLASNLDQYTLQKIHHLATRASLPPEGRRLVNNSWWTGEGLDIFANGVLESVFLVTDIDSFVQRAMDAVEDTLEEV
ncbi:hypothetical protein K458DRAFT_384871 [Lentithecium fluviatile CBS 122367]|uniref:Uncharacterized protein n=1 Tax=Lentithecium fluviatile CBS 122367 TaxID=1168545 RepID=A0A6G1JDQ4_9PLEO|nr:hypothetical protein K458DRAFT_384871 [Lentithecium fluviatile CBS 122367]